MTNRFLSAVALNLVVLACTPSLYALSGAIFTTVSDGTVVNANQYDSKCAVYLDGGPGPHAPATAAGLPDGEYYFQVTDPNGKTLLSTDPCPTGAFGCLEASLSLIQAWVASFIP